MDSLQSHSFHVYHRVTLKYLLARKVPKGRGGGNTKKKAIANMPLAFRIRNHESDRQRPQGRRLIKENIMLYCTEKKKKKVWQQTGHALEFLVAHLSVKPSKPNPCKKNKGKYYNQIPVYWLTIFRTNVYLRKIQITWVSFFFLFSFQNLWNSQNIKRKWHFLDSFLYSLLRLF